MRLTALRGRVVTDYEVWTEGTVLLGDGAIADVDREGSSLADGADEVHEYPESLILPGFVDLQVNGAFGVDVASEPDRLGELSRALLRTGTTAYLPTVISSPESLYEGALPVIAGITGGPQEGAEVLGVHLEGPSPEREEQRGRERGPEDGRDLAGEREEAEELPELLRRRERHEHHPSYGPHPAERHADEGSRHEEHPGARRPRGEQDGDEPDH